MKPTTQALRPELLQFALMPPLTACARHLRRAPLVLACVAHMQIPP